ncbi:MAG: flagellar protein FliT [Schwartzia sp. (in: firmicutes)]
MAARTARSLWQQFLTLTEEMKKFIEKDDVDMFFSLASQREKVFQWIEALPADDFRETPEGKALLSELKPLDLSMQQAAKRWLNTARKRSESVEAYTRAYEFDDAPMLTRSFDKAY